MYRNYLLTALRHLFRHKAYSFINIAGLSLGLAAAMLILLFVKDEVSYDRFHDNKSQIYRVVRRLYNPDGSTFASDGYTGLLQGPRFAANIPGIKGYVRIINNYQDIKTGTDIRSQPILRVDANFFTVFSFPLLQGDPQTALAHPNSIVITEEMARREFGRAGAANALNKTLLIRKGEAFIPYTVTAVVKNCPQNSSIKFEALTPIDPATANIASTNGWMEVFLNSFVVLAPGADPRQIEARMKQVYEREAGAELEAAGKAADAEGEAAGAKRKASAGPAANKPSGKKWTPCHLLQPLTAMHLSKDYPPIDGLADASNPVFSYILSGIALFVLLIACINFVNLTIARSLRRAKEIGIRKVIGSSRRQLIVRFFGESVALCAIAFTLAIGLVQLLLPLFNELSGKALALAYLLDAKLITEYILLFVLTSLAEGFYPALVLSGYDPVTTLYNRFALGGRNFLQKGLVTGQFALASFLIVATGIIAAQFNFLVNQKLGYDDTNLVLVHEWGLKPGQFGSIARHLQQSPDILGVAGRNLGWDNDQAEAEGQAAQINTTIETVDAAYLPLLRIPIAAGRNFAKEYPSDSAQSVLVNETFVREAGWGAPIGRTIRLGLEGHPTVRVIGVVKDHYFQPLNVKIKAQVFSLSLGRGIASFFIKIRPGSEASVLPFIEKTFKARLPLNPFDYHFKDQENRANYEAEARWKQILSFGAAITIFISCIGLFGLSVFAAEKRTKEIGIRKVLGASVSRLAAGLSTGFLRLVVIALLIAMPIAWLAADKWLANYPYRVIVSGWLFAGVALLVTGIAAATVSVQAIKAAAANPVRALRSE